MKQYGSNCFARRTPLSHYPRGWGQKVNGQLFQKVMFRIKFIGIKKCSNMVANILPADTPPPQTLEMGSIGKSSIFSSSFHVAYHIKWNHENCCILPISLPLMLGSKGKNSTISEHCHVAYQIKGNHECSNMVANILPTTPPPLLPPRP